VKTETDKTHLLRIARAIGDIRVIYDVGALHALDGIELALELGANELHTFECNPPSIENCRRNLQEHLGKSKVNYNLCPCAVADEAGELEFHPIDTARTVTLHADGNPGASSLFVANKRYPNETYVQTSLRVRATTLDDYTREHASPDLLWLDLQGAEVMALRGGKNALSRTKIVHTEVGFRPMYTGQALFWDIDSELRRQGFKLAHIDVGRWPKVPRFYSLIRWGPWLGNAIYVRG
jgi:FkbM family methyltransferase